MLKYLVEKWASMPVQMNFSRELKIIRKKITEMLEMKKL